MWAAIALAIKVDSPGPVFFRQERIGRGGLSFGMYKFRSMYLDAEERLAELEGRNEATGPIFKMKDDPRVTRVGRVLRRFSLDEFPQLLNVLGGEMSLVGPRPPLPREVVNYGTAEWPRLGVQPGMTGLWQVSGRSDLSFDEMVRLDLFYIENWSVGLDLGLIVRTVPAVVFPSGAYCRRPAPWCRDRAAPDGLGGRLRTLTVRRTRRASDDRSSSISLLSRYRLSVQLWRPDLTAETINERTGRTGAAAPYRTEWYPWDCSHAEGPGPSGPATGPARCGGASSPASRPGRWPSPSWGSALPPAGWPSRAPRRGIRRRRPCSWSSTGMARTARAWPRSPSSSSRTGMRSSSTLRSR